MVEVEDVIGRLEFQLDTIIPDTPFGIGYIEACEFAIRLLKEVQLTNGEHKP